jgi:hypothetical protein
VLFLVLLGFTRYIYIRVKAGYSNIQRAQGERYEMTTRISTLEPTNIVVEQVGFSKHWMSQLPVNHLVADLFIFALHERYWGRAAEEAQENALGCAPWKKEAMVAWQTIPLPKGK